MSPVRGVAQITKAFTYDPKIHPPRSHNRNLATKILRKANETKEELIVPH
jgi:hypothetical protein